MNQSDYEKYEILLSKMGEVALQLNEYMQDFLPQSDNISSLADAMRYGVLNGGKRIRPFLVLESCKIFQYDLTKEPQYFAVAASLEMIHCYSLIHDDLPAMDNDDFRRGKPTTHKKFNEWSAILAGDGLLTWAFYLLARHGLTEYMLELSKNSFRMVEGQARDMSPNKELWTISEIKEMQGLKTGALLAYACWAGAKLGGASRLQQDYLQEFGSLFGVLFQISDDLLDIYGDSEKMGKSAQKDYKQDKISLVQKMGLEQTKIEITKIQAEIHKILGHFGDKSQNLRLLCEYIFVRDK